MSKPHLCEDCGKQESRVHLTMVIEGEATQLHLCESCAEARKIDLNLTQGSVADMLLGDVEASGALVPVLGHRECTTCGISREKFKSSGRLGCGDCYGIFIDDLEPVIQSMHHSDQHFGKTPLSEGRRAVATKQLASLKRKLDRAILHEEFEEAAKLRDRIRGIEKEV